MTENTVDETTTKENTSHTADAREDSITSVQYKIPSFFYTMA